MDITIKKNQDNTKKIIISGSLSVESVRQLHELLKTEIENKDPLSLDLQNVTDMDVAVLQLLCSAHKSSIKSGKTICLNILSDNLWELINRSGYFHNRGCSKGYEPCLWESNKTMAPKS